MDRTHITENMLQHGLRTFLKPLVCIVNGLSNFKTLLNSVWFNFHDFLWYVKDLSFTTNVAAMLPESEPQSNHSGMHINGHTHIGIGG